MRREGARDSSPVTQHPPCLPSPSVSPSSGLAAAATPKRMKGRPGSGRPRLDRERAPAALSSERSRLPGPRAPRAAAAARALAEREAERLEQEAAAAAEGPR